MNAKERIINSINYNPVDRIPAGLFGTSTDYLKGFVDYMGCKTIEELFRLLSIDIWHAWSSPLCEYKGGAKVYKGQKLDPVQPLYWEHNPNPPFSEATSLEDVAMYPFPSPDEFDYASLSKEMDEHGDFAICAGINAAIFHNYLYMCGQINGMCLLKSEPEIAYAIISRITDFWVGYLRRVLEVANGRTTLIENCNDFGTQRSMFVSPQDFKTFFKPQLKRLYDVTHEFGAYIIQHSCGSVLPIIGEFIEAGADVLNPIQVSADEMNLENVVKKHYGEIAFYGGIDTQYLLPLGTPADVRKGVEKAVSLFGSKSGFILSGSQGLMHDIPYCNAKAMLDPELRK